MTDPVLDLLVKARSFLKGPENYCKGMRWNGEGGRCALGLLDAASFGVTEAGGPSYCGPDGPTYEGAVSALYEGIPLDERRPYPHQGTEIKTPPGYVARYNNDTNYETVAAWFDRTIAVRRLATQGVAVEPEPELETV